MSAKRPRTGPPGPPKATLEYEGTANFRARLVLSCLSARPVRIRAIRPDDESPGLSSFEASFVRLLDKLTNGTHVEINETGTQIYFRPGLIVGGAVEHDCGGSSPGARSAGWFLEGIAPLGAFAKKPIHLKLDNCVTNDATDPSVDSFKEMVLPVLRRFGVGGDAETAATLDMIVKRRGALPGGGGLVEFRCMPVRALRPIDWTDPGLVKRVRGVAYATKVSPQVANRQVTAARGVFNSLLPDVYVFTDVYSGKTSGNSPGFGILLTTESTTGSQVSGEACAEGPGLPEDVAKVAASRLLDEVLEGGCVDSTHQVSTELRAPSRERSAMSAEPQALSHEQRARSLHRAKSADAGKQLELYAPFPAALVAFSGCPCSHFFLFFCCCEHDNDG